MTVPSSPMTYYLAGGEIVEARVGSSSREVAIAKLRWLGVQVYKGRDGGVMGQVAFDPSRLTHVDGVRIEPYQRFRALDQERLQILAPSPLARCRPIRFIDAQSHDELVERIQAAWRAVVDQAHAALQRARQLAPQARLMTDPWRIEGSVAVSHDDVQLLFSAQGDRACVCGLNGRALVSQPVNPRIIIPVVPDGSQQEQLEVWRSAVVQARTCLGRQPEVLPEEASLSLDLASQDLEQSYGKPPVSATRPPWAGGPPGAVGPGTAAAPPPLHVVANYGDRPPPRMPPPSRPALRLQAAAPPSQEPSLDLLILDISDDLGSLDLPD